MTNTDIVNRLASQAYRHLSKKIQLNCALLGGDFGENMLLFMTGKDTKAEECLKQILNSIQGHSQVPTYCNGLAGLGVGLLWLEQEKIIDGVSDNLSDFDVVLLNCMRQMVVEDNFDFLHGAVGIGLYFVDRFKTQPEISALAIRKLVEAINLKTIRNADGAIRLVYDHKDPVKRFNISLSHGLSGTMLFLCRVMKTGIADSLKNQISELLEGMKLYLIGQMQDMQSYGSYFPTFPVNNDAGSRKSRLAWCYGDLGILLALLRTAQTLSDERLTTEIISMLTVEARYRRNLRQNMIHDACLCHGSAGVAQIFKCLFYETGCEEFNDAYRYWLDVTLKFMTVSDDGDVHFRMYDNMTGAWKADSCILDGDSGIGLFLNGDDKLLNHILLID